MRINPIKSEAGGLTCSLPEPFEICRIKFRILSPPLGGVFLGDGHLPPSSTAPSQGLRESLNFDILDAPKPHRRKSPLGHVPTFGTPRSYVWNATVSRHSALGFGKRAVARSLSQLLRFHVKRPPEPAMRSRAILLASAIAHSDVSGQPFRCYPAKDSRASGQHVLDVV